MHRIRLTGVACAALLATAVLLPFHAAADTITAIDPGDTIPILEDDVELGGDDGGIPLLEQPPGSCGDDCIPGTEPGDGVPGPGGDDGVFEGPINGDLPGPIGDDPLPGSVPEPATLTMLGLALAGLYAMGRRRD